MSFTRFNDIGDEHRLLLDLLRSDRESLVSRRCEPSSWEKMLSLSESHRIASLVASRLLRLNEGSDFAPAGVTERCHELLRAVAGMNFLRIQRLEALVSALEAEGIAAVILKGASLCRTAYASPEERMFADLDLLVPREQVERAIPILHEFGLSSHWGSEQDDHYLLWHFHLVLSDREGTVLELHWELTRHHDPYGLPAEGVLARRVALDATGRRHESLEDQLLHSVAQFLSEGGAGLLRLCDVDTILRRAGDELDWQGIEERARAGRLTAGLDVMLHLAAGLLGTPRPKGAQRVQAPRSVYRGLSPLRPRWSLLTRRMERRRAYGRLLRFWLLPGARGTVLRHALLGNPRDRSRPLPPGVRPPARWKRLLRLPRRALSVAGLVLLQVASVLRGKREPLSHS